MNKHIYLLGMFLSYLPSLFAQPHADYLGAGHDQGLVVYTSHAQEEELLGSITVDGFQTAGALSLSDAARFLAHATFGADYELVEETASMGFDAWIDEQQSLPITYVTPNIPRVIDAIALLNDGETLEEEEKRLSFIFRSAWWETILNADDQLRQRVAFALSEIFVISDQSDELFTAANGLADYYDMLLANAFGNYRDLLLDVSLHPCMGFYLSHLNNPKGNPEVNRRPDENYAREIQQLFSIGLYELNPDGSRKVDDGGQYIPTYDNDDIREFAKVFTGLGGGAWNDYFIAEAEAQGETLPDQVNFGTYFGLISPTEPMVMVQNQHETSEKFLLQNTVLPANRPGMEDVEAAIDNLFYHPNVGPFISRLLIQRLVMSNPSPGYVGRVASVFHNDGSGVRGDLGAVVRAILLDEEARNCQALFNPTGGKLREPILRYTHLLRAFKAQPLAGAVISTGVRFQLATGQFPLSSPTVFNFFLPDYQPNGPIKDQSLVAPEFQIHSNSSGIGYVNEAFNWMLAEGGGNILPFYFSTTIDPEDLGFSLGFLNLREETQLSEDPGALMDYLDIVLTHGQLSEASRTIIQNSIEVIPQEALEIRVRLAIYLIMISPDYTILK
ncbi:MAG: DUF1800 family protein [Bacteroidota bacterium]